MNELWMLSSIRCKPVLTHKATVREGYDETAPAHPGDTVALLDYQDIKFKVGLITKVYLL